MAEDTGLNQFALRLQGEVIERAGGEDADAHDADFKENVFTTLVTEYLIEAGALDDAVICHFSKRTGKGNLKINAYAFDEETRQLDLVVAHYSHESLPGRIGKTDVTKPLDQLLRFYNAAIDGLHDEMEAAHDDYAMVRRICDVRSDIERVRCLFVTDGITSLTSLPSKEVDGKPVRFEIWDIERLYRASMAPGAHESISIDFIERFGQPLPCLRVEEDLKDYTAYVAIIPGAILNNLYEEYGSRLLELNVRSFLQARGKVNRGIRDTLKNDPERFLAYNNGISTTAESVELATDKSGAESIRLIRGLQIVNGGQTTASIQRAHKEDKVDLSKVYVQAKISVVDPACIDEVVPMISRYANSQNAVREADFSANDPFHIEIERLSETIWCPGEQSRWYYERARGQYQVSKSKEATTKARHKQFETKCPSSQKFAKTDLAKYVHSWDQLPHLVSKGAQKNFVEFMLRLRGRGREWTPDADYFRNLASQAILFKRTERLVRQIQIPAYGANVVTYAIAYLSYRSAGRLDLSQIWDSQDLSEGVRAALTSWCPLVYQAIVDGAAGRNVTEWAKKEECWRQVRALVLPIPKSLSDELSDTPLIPTVGNAVPSGQDISQADQERIARVMQVPAETWFKISDLGRQTGKLKAWQAGIAHTLSGYASDGWQRVPSTKQATQAVRILEIAADELDIAVAANAI